MEDKKDMSLLEAVEDAADRVNAQFDENIEANKKADNNSDNGDEGNQGKEFTYLGSIPNREKTINQKDSPEP